MHLFGGVMDFNLFPNLIQYSGFVICIFVLIVLLVLYFKTKFSFIVYIKGGGGDICVAQGGGGG